MHRLLVLAIGFLFMANMPWVGAPKVKKQGIRLRKINYKGWRNSLLLSNRFLEMIILTDVGPRIYRLRRKNGKNIFYNDPRMVGRRGGRYWHSYGGHRLWHAPEKNPRTYIPDNHRVKWQKIKGGVRLSQILEKSTGIQKQLEIRLSADKPLVEITHILQNRNAWEINVSAWALSVLAKGARAILPMPPRARHHQHLSPVGGLILWSYTDLADKRFVPGNEFLQVLQNPKKEAPFKIGLSHENTWGAIVINRTLFIKATKNYPQRRYPDRGSRFELFTSGTISELETLSPLTLVPPEGKIVHKEYWWLEKWQGKIKTEQQIRRYVYPSVQKLLQEVL